MVNSTNASLTNLVAFDPHTLQVINSHYCKEGKKLQKKSRNRISTDLRQTINNTFRIQMYIVTNKGPCCIIFHGL